MLSLMPPSTETKVRTPSISLTVPDLVDGDRPRPDDPAAGLDRQRRHGEAVRRALALDDGAQRPAHVDDVGRVVRTGVRDAEPAAEVELGQLDAELVAHLGEQPDHPVRRDLEAAGVEDLRADVRVQPDQLEPGRRQHPAYGVERVAADQREAELLVLVRGRDELVGVRLDADGAADQDALRRAALDAQPAEPVDLGDRVDDDPGRRRRRGRRPARRPTCCCRAAASGRPGSRPAPRPRARRRCTRRGRAPPPRPSGRPRRRGTPWPRRRPSRRRTPRGSRGSAGAGRPRRAGRPGCRARRPGRARRARAGRAGRRRRGSGRAARPPGRVRRGRPAGPACRPSWASSPDLRPGRVGAHRRTATSARAR